MTRRGALALIGLLASWPMAADAAADAARAELARERRLLAGDTSRLSDISRRLDTALTELAAASRAVAEGAARSDAPEDLIRREDALSAAEQDVRSLLDRRRILAERVLDRRRRVAMLEGETQAKRQPGDVLNGRWTVLVDPGEQRGTFRLTLQGAIVSGEYTLEGGYTGSLRGTLVNDRLRLERVDSTLGFNAIFYGRLSQDGREIVGTWEATTLGTGEAGSGRWRAAREDEREESP
jgi:hypothetical protein